MKEPMETDYSPRQLRRFAGDLIVFVALMWLVVQGIRIVWN